MFSLTLGFVGPVATGEIQATARKVSDISRCISDFQGVRFPQ